MFQIKKNIVSNKKHCINNLESVQNELKSKTNKCLCFKQTKIKKQNKNNVSKYMQFYVICLIMFKKL